MKRKNTFKLLSILLILSLVINIPTTSYAKPKVKLNKKNVILTLGNEVELKVKNTTSKVKWSSNNKKVATVNQYGEVTAWKAGTAKITATVNSNKYTCKVKVPKQYMKETKITIKKNASKTLLVLGVSNKYDSIYWYSDDEDIASVTQSGKVTGKKNGTTTVYAVLNSGLGSIYECKVTVSNEAVNNTDSDKNTDTDKNTNTNNSSENNSNNNNDSNTTKRKVYYYQEILEHFPIGETFNLNIYGHDDLVYTSSNENIVKTDVHGNIEAVGAGKAEIYLYDPQEDKTWTYEVTVYELDLLIGNPSDGYVLLNNYKELFNLEKVAFPNDNLQITLGYIPLKDTLTRDDVESDIWAHFNRIDARKIEWTISDTSVCYISGYGTVKPNSKDSSGNVTLTAKYIGKEYTFNFDIK